MSHPTHSGILRSQYIDGLNNIEEFGAVFEPEYQADSSGSTDNYNVHRFADLQNMIDSRQRIFGPDGAVYLPSREENMSFHPFHDAPSNTPSHGSSSDTRRYQREDQPIGNLSRSSNLESNYSVPSNIYSAPRMPVSTSTHLGKRMRSGTRIPPTSSANVSPTLSGSAKSTRTKAPRKKGGAEVPKIDGPLSELTKGLTSPVRDMDAWVHRSVQDRQQEVEKKNGYVTRPMNSFMLYRSAYAERTKEWCKLNNHQDVSRFAGQSWPLEPSEVREKYNELARIERDNHARANPNYKFCPSKTGPTSRKRKEALIEGCASDDDGTEGDDGDPEWSPRGGRRQRKKAASESSHVVLPSSRLNNQINPTTSDMTAGAHWQELVHEEPSVNNSMITSSYRLPYFDDPISQQTSSYPLCMNTTIQGPDYGHSPVSYRNYYGLDHSAGPQESGNRPSIIDPSLIMISGNSANDEGQDGVMYLQCHDDVLLGPDELDEWVG